MNLVILKGRLARDVNVSYTQSGKCVATFTVAVNRPVRKENDNGANPTASADFIHCVAWEKQAEFVGNYFSKGKEILLDGVLSTRSYTDKEGNTRYVTEVKANHIEFCGSKAPSSYDDDVPPPQEEFTGASNTSLNDDDIPF